MDFTVLSKVAVRTVAQVVRLTIDANTAVETRIGETFISVDTSLAVQCHHLGLATTFCFLTKGFDFVFLFFYFLFLNQLSNLS